MSDLLTAISVAGGGRSGSTAMMALLGTSPRVAFDRVYPFENRYLAYLAKFALLAERPASLPAFRSLELLDYVNNHFGPRPWPQQEADDTSPLVRPSSRALLLGLWRTLSHEVRQLQPNATHYAEKVPVWIPGFVHDLVPQRVLHLVRDPRDVFLSARDFAQRRATLGFGMDEGTAELQQARHIAHGLLTFAENEHSQRGSDDALLIRYEDWIADPADFAGRLSDFLNVPVKPTANVERHLSRHMTSQDTAASIGRWRREPLPVAVRDTLESQLYHRMADYGYEVSADVRPAAELIIRGHMHSSGDGEVTSADEGSRIEVWGPDFWVELDPHPVNAAAVGEVWVCVRGSTGDHFSLYWRHAGASFAEERSISIPFSPGPHWQVLRFEAGQHALWEGIIAQIRIDFFNGNVEQGAEGAVRWVRYIT